MRLFLTAHRPPILFATKAPCVLHRRLPDFLSEVIPDVIEIVPKLCPPCKHAYAENAR